MSKGIITYLSLNKVDAFSILVALYPILSGYSWGVLHGNIVFIALLACWAVIGRKRIQINMFWLKVLVGFVTFHDLILMSIIPVKSYFINSTISIIIICVSIFSVTKSIDFRKFVGAINWVAIFSIIGLIFQFTQILQGIHVTPIKLPFLPDMESSSRLYEESLRPSSFFWEPAALVTFLMIPLFISLREKKFIWTSVLVLSMFLSTSSTGILMSMVMLTGYVISQKIKFRTRLFVIVIGIGLVYGLTHSSYFEAGIQKIQNTDVEKNSRLMNGFFLYQNLLMEEIIFGFKAANVDDYASQHREDTYILTRDGHVFVPSFWLTLAQYGIVGLVLFLMVFASFIKKDKTTLPYIVVLFISMFFQGIAIGNSLFAFQLIFLYSYIAYSSIVSRQLKVPANEIKCLIG